MIAISNMDEIRFLFQAIRANKKLKMLIGRLLAETVASAPIQPPSSDGNHQNHQIANNNNMASLNMTVPNSTPSSFLIETSLNNQRNDVFESSEPPSPVSPSDLIWINERGEHVVNPAQMPGYGEVSKVGVYMLLLHRCATCFSVMGLQSLPFLLETLGLVIGISAKE